MQTRVPMNIECLNFLIAINIYRNILLFQNGAELFVINMPIYITYPLEKIVNLGSKKFR